MWMLEQTDMQTHDKASSQFLHVNVLVTLKAIARDNLGIVDCLIQGGSNMTGTICV